jgi:hypothetical protein
MNIGSNNVRNGMERKTSKSRKKGIEAGNPSYRFAG